MNTKSLKHVLANGLHFVFIAALAAGLVLGVEPVRVAHAMTFTVNSTADAVDANLGDSVCATATGECTLRAAIMEANTLSGDDIITLPAGTYTLTIVGADENAATTGDLNITSNLTVNGAGANSTVIDASGIDRVFNVVGSATMNISNVTIQNGNAEFGGGISNGGTLTVANTTLSNNSAGFGGGGIYVYNSGTLTATNTTFSENSAGVGGGILNNFGTLTLNNSTVSGNMGSGGAAGIATQGGTLTLINSTVSNNTGYGGGGGINNSSDGMVTLMNSAIINNTTTDSSGGGMEHNSGTLTVTNSTFSGNRAVFGGGLSVTSGSVSLNNVTIANNTATIFGGGLFVVEGWGGTVSTENTILARNLGPAGSPDCSGTLNSQGYNLILNTTGCIISGDITSNLTGVDPLLGPLQDNSGLTFTHALLPGSLAIDAGNPAPPGSGSNACEATDQRGVARPQGAHCDMGAFELAAVVPYPFNGFLPPVDNPPTYNTVKAGRGVPVKFSLGGDRGLSIFPAGYPTSTKIDCSTSMLFDIIEETVAAGASGLQYDTTTGIYTYVWKTDKAWADTCRELNIKLIDGTSHTALFNFTK